MANDRRGSRMVREYSQTEARLSILASGIKAGSQGSALIQNHIVRDDKNPTMVATARPSTR